MDGWTPNATKAANYLASMPQGSYTLDKPDAKSLILESGGMLLARGYLYNIKQKHIGLDVYEVWLELRN